ncbi:MAG: hypothetical protein Q8Q88_03650 [Phenylobacterium sp.]|uniref:hypothetical protein n=1 Tax=Phenylobacterium sp. TaxID=1871053 RepID=UPI00273526AE|nr:hypothetical protein [Phenylobacterium sp.]MDP3746125.1 hypothetical protein [Phenylobacterium sp.]
MSDPGQEPAADSMRQGLWDLETRTRQRFRKRRHAIVVAFSIALHLAIVLTVFSPEPPAPTAPDPEPITVELFTPPPPPKVELPLPKEDVTPPAPAPTPEPPAPAKSPPKRTAFRQTPAPRTIAPLPAANAPSVDKGFEVSDAQLAGAATAGSGAPSGGGDCNMLRRLQAALRKDAMVQAAVAKAHGGRPIMVWNGDWVRHPSQEGGGLAAVREVIMWEVGFAPPACRSERVRGLVLITLRDEPGSARLVVGSDSWRWSDLLFARAGARGGD